MKPLVSVGMPVYNGERYLTQGRWNPSGRRNMRISRLSFQITLRPIEHLRFVTNMLSETHALGITATRKTLALRATSLAPLNSRRVNISCGQRTMICGSPPM